MRHACGWILVSLIALTAPAFAQPALGDAVNKVGEDAAKAAEGMQAEGEKVAGEVEKAVGDAAGEAKKAMEGMAGDAEKAAEAAGDELKKAADAAGGEMKKTVDGAASKQVAVVDKSGYVNIGGVEIHQQSLIIYCALIAIILGLVVVLARRKSADAPQA